MAMNKATPHSPPLVHADVTEKVLPHSACPNPGGSY